MSVAFINTEVFVKLERDLMRYVAIQRTPAVKAGMKAAVDVVAKRYRQKITGLPSLRSKKDRMRLAQTVRTKVYQEEHTGRVIGRVKTKRPEGTHGHLVEAGHRIVISRGKNKGKDTGKRAKAGLQLAQSWQETEMEQMVKLERGILEALEGKK